MIHAQYINERGWWTILNAPFTDPADREGRLDQAERAFDAFAPVCRPLALGVELCWRELDTGLRSRELPPKSARLLVLEDVEPRVKVQPWLAGETPRETVQRFDRATLAACLDHQDPPDENCLLDWEEIRTLAVALHSSEMVAATTLEQLGSRLIPAYEPSWFAGPIGDWGFPAVAPALMRLRAEERVVCSLGVHWSGWSEEGSADRQSIETATARLVAAGWEPVL